MNGRDTLGMEISIILPSYQEAENLERILPHIRECMGGSKIIYEILVIDTMQPMDNTEQICGTFGVRYIPRRGGNSYGDAIRTGIEEAKGKYIVIMDADGSHDPKEIPRFLQTMEEKSCDLVIGSRYCEGGNTHNGFILKAMSRILNWTYRFVFRLHIKDVSDSYRMYRGEQLKSLELECDNFDIVEEILIRLNLQYPGMKICEIPIYFNRREFGESKRDLFKFILSYLKTMERLLRIVKSYDQ